jgi:bifunctional DNase/RNase
MALVGVRVEVPTNQPIVLLREEDGTRYLPIFIGPPEATAIVYALQGMETPRPMTHDLFKAVLEELTAELRQVVITELHDGTFYAEIEIDRAGSRHRISSRPSDAIALAVRMEQTVPIYATEAVLDEAGVTFDHEDEEVQVEEFREFLDQVSPEDFGEGT